MSKNGFFLGNGGVGDRFNDRVRRGDVTARLGKLEKVVVREVLGVDTRELVDWLGKKENLPLLSSAIGKELTFEAHDKSTGPYRSDLCCKDSDTNAWVLFCVVFDRLAYAQIGELLSYAAGLDEVTLVWVAERVTEDHYATLDWLNTITNDRVRCYALEMDFWRIADSPIAPTFTVVCRPREGGKMQSSKSDRIITNSVSRFKPLMLEYWTEFNQFLLTRQSFIKGQKPMPLHWLNFPLGSPYFQLVVSINARDKVITVGLVLSGPQARANFQTLQQAKFTIEGEVGTSLEWHDLAEKKESHIFLRKSDVDAANHAGWPDQHEWIAQTLEAFHRAFALRVESLVADTNYQRSEVIPDPVNIVSPAVLN